jgi:hypothetical protein
MGSHSEHHDHHSNEKKPVSFIVPLIFGLFVTLVILLFVSLGDPKHGCHEDGGHGEAKECCEKDAGHHGDEHAKDAHGAEEGAHH